MRLRNIPGAKEKIAESKYVINEPKNYKGRWNEIFNNNHPIHIEIGMGKGRFIQTMAINNPEINFIGIEKYPSVLIRALEKREEAPLDNLYYLCISAENIVEIFAMEEVKRVYLNFSDPWPKERYAKRRLTSINFWERYKCILYNEGEVIFKTDNRPLFDYSLEEVESAGWNLESVTFDLHNSEFMADNVMTEYEERFSLEGKPINRLVAKRRIFCKCD